MKINGKSNVKTFSFRHKGLDMNFTCHTMPARYMDSMEIEPAGIGTFEFDDVTEVTQLINMLEDYRVGLLNRMGLWRRTDEYPKRLCTDCKWTKLDPSCVFYKDCQDNPLHPNWEQR